MMLPFVQQESNLLPEIEAQIIMSTPRFGSRDSNCLLETLDGASNSIGVGCYQFGLKLYLRIA